MIKSKSQLIKACKDANIPLSIDAIWNAQVPNSIQTRCEPPSLLFEAFVQHPEGFPYPGELLILWSTNGDSITGFLSQKEIFIEYFLEDGPTEFQIIANSYQQFAAHLVGRAIGMGRITPDSATELSDFFHLKYLDEVVSFVNTSTEWEEGIPNFISSLEQAEN